METKQCIHCVNVDTSRDNDIKELYCKKFNTYVDCYSWCDYFENKIKEAVNNGVD